MRATSEKFHWLVWEVGVKFDEVVRRRRMVHQFQRRRVPAELLREVLDKALHAPSAGFSQGLELLVLQDQGSLDRFWSTTDTDGAYEQMLMISALGPPVLVLVLTDSTAYTDRYSEPDKIESGLDDPDRWPVPYSYVDAGLAALLVLQAAVNRGLDRWFFGLPDGELALRESLGIPARLSFVGVIGLGYRAPNDRPLGSAVTRARRSLDHVLHVEHW